MTLCSHFSAEVLSIILDLKGEAALQTSGCTKSLNISPGTWTGSLPACKKHAWVEDLLQQVAEKAVW